MIYKDIIINYYISDDHGRRPIPYESYREHASSGGYLVKYENHENDIMAVLHMDIILVPNCMIF